MAIFSNARKTSKQKSSEGPILAHGTYNKNTQRMDRVGTGSSKKSSKTTAGDKRKQVMTIVTGWGVSAEVRHQAMGRGKVTTGIGTFFALPEL